MPGGARLRYMAAMTLKVKICGLKTAAAIEAAVSGGADWFGMVFYDKSPRFVAPEQAFILSRVAHGRGEPIGVYVDPSDDLLEATVGAVAWVQLHGTETPERAADIKQRWGQKILKAVRVAEPADVDEAEAYKDVADMILFDAKPKPGWDLPGGNGQPFDWSLLKSRDVALPWVLSGGLDEKNLETAVAASGANAVDVSSGVEITPGEKSVDKIFAFLDRARRIGREQQEAAQ